MDQKHAISRRTMLGQLGAAAALTHVRPAVASARPSPEGSTRFAIVGDTTDLGHGVQADRFGALARRIRSLQPAPEFLLHLGDHVWGLTGDEADLRRQWREWWAAASALGSLPLHHLTGNHTCYSPMSRRIFQEETAARTAPGTERSPDGLQSIWRRGQTVLVMAHTPDDRSGQHGRIDWQWVDAALARHADASTKLVAGHFPALPVNGYAMPCWRVRAEDTVALWPVLLRHRVAAYLCAHIIAFDVQIPEGIPQICSAAGGFPLLYPPQSEYLHFAEIEIGPHGVAWRAIDEEGTVREQARWPFETPALTEWRPLGAPGAALPVATAADHSAGASVLLLRFEGRQMRHADVDQTLLTGWNDSDAPPAVWIGTVGRRLEVRISPRRGDPALRWRGPSIAEGDIAFDLALYGAMGPGGVLHRVSESQPWTSLPPESSGGFAGLAWPTRWASGVAHTGFARRISPAVLALLDYVPGLLEPVDPFLGTGLTVRAAMVPVASSGLSYRISNWSRSNWNLPGA